MSAIIAAPEQHQEQEQVKTDLRVIDFYLKREERRTDWGNRVWIQVAVYSLLVGFVAISFAASMFVLSLIR